MPPRSVGFHCLVYSARVEAKIENGFLAFNCKHFRVCVALEELATSRSRNEIFGIHAFGLKSFSDWLFPEIA